MTTLTINYVTGNATFKQEFVTVTGGLYEAYDFTVGLLPYLPRQPWFRYTVSGVDGAVLFDEQNQISH